MLSRPSVVQYIYNGWEKCASDDPSFRDERWRSCEDWQGQDCLAKTSELGYTTFGKNLLLCHCPLACGSYHVCRSDACAESCTVGLENKRIMQYAEQDGNSVFNPDTTGRTEKGNAAGITTTTTQAASTGTTSTTPLPKSLNKGTDFCTNPLHRKPDFSTCNIHTQCGSGYCSFKYRICFKDTTQERDFEYGVYELPSDLKASPIGRMIISSSAASSAGGGVCREIYHSGTLKENDPSNRYLPLSDYQKIATLVIDAYTNRTTTADQTEKYALDGFPGQVPLGFRVPNTHWVSANGKANGMMSTAAFYECKTTYLWMVMNKIWAGDCPPSIVNIENELERKEREEKLQRMADRNANLTATVISGTVSGTARASSDYTTITSTITTPPPDGCYRKFSKDHYLGNRTGGVFIPEKTKKDEQKDFDLKISKQKQMNEEQYTEWLANEEKEEEFQKEKRKHRIEFLNQENRNPFFVRMVIDFKISRPADAGMLTTEEQREEQKEELKEIFKMGLQDGIPQAHDMNISILGTEQINAKKIRVVDDFPDCKSGFDFQLQEPKTPLVEEDADSSSDIISSTSDSGSTTTTTTTIHPDNQIRARLLCDLQKMRGGYGQFDKLEWDKKLESLPATPMQKRDYIMSKYSNRDDESFFDLMKRHSKLKPGDPSYPNAYGLRKVLIMGDHHQVSESVDNLRNAGNVDDLGFTTAASKVGCNWTYNSTTVEIDPKLHNLSCVFFSGLDVNPPTVLPEYDTEYVNKLSGIQKASNPQASTATTTTTVPTVVRRELSNSTTQEIIRADFTFPTIVADFVSAELSVGGSELFRKSFLSYVNKQGKNIEKIEVVGSSSTDTISTDTISTDTTWSNQPSSDVHTPGKIVKQQKARVKARICHKIKIPKDIILPKDIFVDNLYEGSEWLHVRTAYSGDPDSANSGSKSSYFSSLYITEALNFDQTVGLRRDNYADVVNYLPTTDYACSSRDWSTTYLKKTCTLKTALKNSGDGGYKDHQLLDMYSKDGLAVPKEFLQELQDEDLMNVLKNATEEAVKFVMGEQKNTGNTDANDALLQDVNEQDVRIIGMPMFRKRCPDNEFPPWIDPNAEEEEEEEDGDKKSIPRNLLFDSVKNAVSSYTDRMMSAASSVSGGHVIFDFSVDLPLTAEDNYTPLTTTTTTTTESTTSTTESPENRKRYLVEGELMQEEQELAKQRKLSSTLKKLAQRRLAQKKLDLILNSLDSIESKRVFALSFGTRLGELLESDSTGTFVTKIRDVNRFNKEWLKQGASSFFGSLAEQAVSASDYIAEATERFANQTNLTLPDIPDIPETSNLNSTTTLNPGRQLGTVPKHQRGFMSVRESRIIRREMKSKSKKKDNDEDEKKLPETLPNGKPFPIKNVDLPRFAIMRKTKIASDTRSRILRSTYRGPRSTYYSKKQRVFERSLSDDGEATFWNEYMVTSIVSNEPRYSLLPTPKYEFYVIPPEDAEWFSWLKDFLSSPANAMIATFMSLLFVFFCIGGILGYQEEKKQKALAKKKAKKDAKKNGGKSPDGKSGKSPKSKKKDNDFDELKEKDKKKKKDSKDSDDPGTAKKEKKEKEGKKNKKSDDDDGEMKGIKEKKEKKEKKDDGGKKDKKKK